MKIKLYLIVILAVGFVLFESSCKRPVNFDPNDIIDGRDNKRYPTVVYGNQRWMAQNLDYNLSGSHLNPDNPFTEYGRLYTFEQAKVACPDGWHLPTDAEWKIMESTIGINSSELSFLGYRGINIGRALKSTAGWVQNGGNNELGFNAYPAGVYKGTDKSFYDLARNANYWTASDSASNSISAWYRGLSKDFNGLYRQYEKKLNAFSCRCVKD
jgi:uncharacterized protein (TIGR02145 family)